MAGRLPDEQLDSFADELYKIANVEKTSTFGSEKVLTPFLNRIGFNKGVGKLVEWGSADIPHTPRLLMRHRTPAERVALGQRVGESATKMVAEHPEIVPMQAVPIPGITPAYLAAKKGLSMAMKKEAQVEPYQQKTQHTCSAACLVAVLGHYGFEADEHDMAGMIGVRQKGGAETKQIAEAARRLGLDAFEYSFDSLDQAAVLTRQGIPIIADIQSFKHPGSGHYVVVTDIDEKGVHLMDPNVDGNIRLISHEEMDERWWDRAMQPPHKMMPKWGIVVLPPESA